MNTYQTIATRTNTTVPPHLQAQAEIPVIPTGKAARQGDVYILPTQLTPRGDGIPLTGQGHKVIEGEADRNSHILNGDGRFHPGKYADNLLDYGLLTVPDSGTCYLTHTAEHGSIGIPAGTYRILGQADYAAELRRAAD